MVSFFSGREEILRKCVGSRSAFPSGSGVIDKLSPSGDVTSWCLPTARYKQLTDKVNGGNKGGSDRA